MRATRIMQKKCVLLRIFAAMLKVLALLKVMSIRISVYNPAILRLEESAQQCVVIR